MVLRKQIKNIREIKNPCSWDMNRGTRGCESKFTNQKILRYPSECKRDAIFDVLRELEIVLSASTEYAKPRTIIVGIEMDYTDDPSMDFCPFNAGDKLCLGCTLFASCQGGIIRIRLRRPALSLLCENRDLPGESGRANRSTWCLSRINSPLYGEPHVSLIADRSFHGAPRFLYPVHHLIWNGQGRRGIPCQCSTLSDYSLYPMVHWSTVSSEA